MDLQQKFGQRLLALLTEKNISQGDFADKVVCSRQSINFYILGKRSPDITLAAKMAQYLEVSCDYLIGFSDFRSDKEANFTVNQVGLTENTVKFFAGLKLTATDMAQGVRGKFETFDFDNSQVLLSHNRLHAERTLDILNSLISHDQFGILLQYVKRYCDICRGEDEITILKNFMFQLESPDTGKKYGTEEESLEIMQEFCLHVASKYFDEIVKDISK